VKELIKQILKEELSLRVRRLINFDNMDDIVKKIRIAKFQKDKPIKNSINGTIQAVAHELMGNQLDKLEDEEYWKEYDELKKFLTDTFEEELTEYFEKRKRDADEETNPLELKYVFVKHDKPYYDRGWRGFTDSFKSFDDMITRYGNWVDVDWDEIKKKLDTINDFPDNQFNGWYYSRPLRIKSIGDEGNKWGYNFSVIKAIPYENLDKIVKESKDPKVGTGKKPKGSGRRLYTDENPNDTVSVKFRTKEDIIDTLNKESFKSKPHKRQSQIINLIHQRVRAAYQNAKDPETKKRLKRAYDYIENRKEESKQKTIRLQKQEQTEGEITERCWKGYTQKGMKTMFGKRYPNCVKVKK